VEDLVSPNEPFWRGKRVLVTGHSGFKGAWLSLWLERLGAHVTGVGLPPESDPSLFALVTSALPIESIFCDIRDFEAIRRVIVQSRPEVLFHLAAQALVRRSYHDPIATLATNVMGTVHVLEAAREVGNLRAVVVVTSDKCYENQERDRPYREPDCMGGFDPYSCSKGCAELVTAAWRRSFFNRSPPNDVGVASVRAGNVIGGGDWSFDRLIPDCIPRSRRAKSLQFDILRRSDPGSTSSTRSRAMSRWPSACGAIRERLPKRGISDHLKMMLDRWHGLSNGWRACGEMAPRGGRTRVRIRTRPACFKSTPPKRGRNCTGGRICRSKPPSNGPSTGIVGLRPANQPAD